MAYRLKPSLADVPKSGRTYYPSAAELATAQAASDAGGYGTVAQPWNIEADGSTFEVPTDRGGLPGATTGYMVRFGFGRGAFANFPPPAPGVGASPQIAAATPTASVQSALVAAVASPAPAAALPVTASVTTPAGSVPVSAVVETAAPAAAPAGAGFDVGQFFSSLFAAPAMQPVNQQLAQVAVPAATSAVKTAITNWIAANQALVYGGGAAVVLGGIYLATRRGRGRR